MNSECEEEEYGVLNAVFQDRRGLHLWGRANVLDGTSRVNAREGLLGQL